jgi:hypothetical protein
MNFYFCETCGKRITENDIEAGQARNKKLKGVYCTGCAVGVMTMETLPLSKEEARQILQASREQSKAPSIPHEAPGARPPRPLPVPDKRQGNLILVGVVGIAAIAISMVLVLRSSGPVSPPRREQAAEQATEQVATLTAPQASIEKPMERPVSKTSTPPAPAGDVQSNKAPVVMPAPSPAVTTVPVALPPPPPDKTLPGKETSPAPAPSTQVNPAAQPPEVVSVNKGREQFAVILKELAPILKQNRFTVAQDLLESRRRDPALPMPRH